MKKQIKRTAVVLPEGSNARIDVAATAAFIRGQKAARINILVKVAKVMIEQIAAETEDVNRIAFHLSIINDALDNIEQAM